YFFFSSRRRHTRSLRDWSSDVCSSDLAGGLCSDDVAYGIADAEGNLVSEQWFKQPYLATIHDFVITEKYAIWPIFPTTADLDRRSEERRVGKECRARGSPDH